MMGVAADTMHGAADMMAQWVSQDQCQTPPLYGKNKLILNQYLGIFMHFETIFFFNLENGLFQKHPPTKCGKFQNILLSMEFQNLPTHPSSTWGKIKFLDKIFIYGKKPSKPWC